MEKEYIVRAVLATYFLFLGRRRVERNRMRVEVKNVMGEIGKRYGRLVIRGVEKVNGLWYCECECECGVKCRKILSNVVSGKSESCGCILREIRASDKGESLERYGSAISRYERGERMASIAKDLGISRQRLSVLMKGWRDEGIR